MLLSGIKRTIGTCHLKCIQHSHVKLLVVCDLNCLISPLWLVLRATVYYKQLSVIVVVSDIKLHHMISMISKSSQKYKNNDMDNLKHSEIPKCA